MNKNILTFATASLSKFVFANHTNEGLVNYAEKELEGAQLFWQSENYNSSTNKF